ncbi:MAG: PKD domain-containing protein, partial [Sphingobacteriales bacterium]
MNAGLRLLLLLTVCTTLFSQQVKAQLIAPNQPEQDACNALMICGNTFTSPYGYQGIGLVSDLTNTPCFGGEGNVMWLRLEINTSGTIVFSLTPIIATDDYDFAVVNASAGCSGLTSANAIRCNFNNNNPGSNIAGAIGLNATSTIPTVPAGTFGSSYCQQINAVAGEVYLIMINNFGYYTGVGGPTSGFTIDFSGSTAVFNQPPPPEFQQILPYCDLSQQITIKLNTQVLCSSIATNGSDFYLTPSGTIGTVQGLNCTGASGYTDKIKITFSSPLPNGDYTLHAQTGSDGNTLLGLCNSELVLPDILNFHVGLDPIAVLSIDSPACQKLKLNLNTPVACNSIAPNGSDFIVLGPSNVYVASATGTGCIPGGFTSAVEITLSAPIAVDGLYKVRAQIGNDGNSVIDSCGRIVPPGLEVPFTVNSFNGILQAYPDSTICNVGSTVTLYGVNNGPPPPGGFSYQWIPSADIANPTSLVTQVTVPAFRNYYVLQTIDANGCYLRDSAKLIVKPFFAELTPLKANICIDDPLQLQASGGELYSWFDDAGLTNVPSTTLSCTDCPDPKALPPLGVNNYYVLVSNDVGCRDTIKTEITVNPKPTAAFTGNNLFACTAPLTTTFTNTSTGGTGYSWSFGDGGTSTAVSPVHTYTANGVYTVVLVAQNANGCRDTLRRVDYIAISPPKITGIGPLPAQGCVPYPVTFSPTVAAGQTIVNYQWEFGDGATGTGINPSHTYTTEGTYTVKLKVTAASGCTDSFSFPAGVKVGNKPMTAFSATPLIACAQDPVHFTD